MGGNDYVFGNGGADQVAHSYGNDRIFGGCGSDTVRGGFGLDRIFANMPDGLYPSGTRCVSITAPLSAEQSAALERAVNDDVPDRVDIPDRAHDLVDCAWIASRGDPQPDKGFGSEEVGDIPDVRDDTVVDCSNRDDQ
jgi:Ca2+-binding RTX toxin-like protein